MEELKSANKKLASLQPDNAVQDEEQRKNARVLETCAKLVEDLEQTRQKLSESTSEAESLRTVLKHKVSVMEKIKDDLMTFQVSFIKFRVSPDSPDIEALERFMNSVSRSRSRVKVESMLLSAKCFWTPLVVSRTISINGGRRMLN